MEAQYVSEKLGKLLKPKTSEEILPYFADIKKPIDFAKAADKYYDSFGEFPPFEVYPLIYHIWEDMRYKFPDNVEHGLYTAEWNKIECSFKMNHRHITIFQTDKDYVVFKINPFKRIRKLRKHFIRPNNYFVHNMDDYQELIEYIMK